MRRDQDSSETTISVYSTGSEAAQEIERSIDDRLDAAIERVSADDITTLSGRSFDSDSVAVIVSRGDPLSFDLIRAISSAQDGASVLAVGAESDLSAAMEAMQTGATGYYTVGELDRLVRDVDAQPEAVRVQCSDAYQAFADFITRDEGLHGLINTACLIARSSVSVLITGETGVGKELFAHGVHRASDRSGEFVVENVAGLDDTLFSDALFGHRRGAFTGAVTDRPGLVERAKGGTLFLDEIGDISPASQVKLLRLLENGTYYPLGSDEPRVSSARIVLATNRNILEQVRSGAFRLDLFFRLAAFHLQIPPLRHRKQDIVPLFDHFVSQTAEELQITAPNFHPSVTRLLEGYDYPGNVRELQSIVVTLVSHGRDDRLAPAAIENLTRSILRRNTSADIPTLPIVAFSDTLPTMEELTDQLIDEALLRTEGNQSAAARMLGVTASAINKRLHRRDGGATDV